MLTALSDFAHSLGQCTDIEQSSNLLAAELSDLGFEQFVYALILKTAEGSVSEVIPTGTLNPEWVEIYFTNGFDKNDYACAHCMQSSAPLDWLHMFNTVNDKPQLEKFQRTSSAVQDFGFHNGVTMPISQRKRRASLMSIVPPKEVKNCDHKENYCRNRDEILQITEAFDAKMEMLSLGAVHYSLTKREIEMLKWLSDGVAPKAIAQKTKTSVHTINKQILSAKVRLDCGTTMHAVSKALILGAI